MDSQPLPNPPSRRRRGLKIVLVITGLMLVLIALLPTIISATGILRSQVQKGLRDQFGTDVELADLSFGWLSGVEIEGLRIPNPRGFPQERPALSMRRMAGDLSLAKLLRGRIDLLGACEGLEIELHQRTDGTSNFQQLLGIEVSGDTSGTSRSGQIQDDGTPDDVDHIRLDLRLVDARVEIFDRERGLLESLRALNASIHKPFGTSHFKLELDAQLHRPDDPDRPGSLHVAADVDSTYRQPVEIVCRVAKLDLSRYRALLDTFLGADQLSQFAGVVTGDLNAQVDIPGDVIDIRGDLSIDAPHFAGPLLSGLDVADARWKLNPAVNVKLNSKDGGLPEVDTTGFTAELGFATFRAISAADASKLVAGRRAVGLKFDVDLTRVLAMGGPIPKLLGGAKGRAEGAFALAITKDWQDPAKLLDSLRQLVHVDTSVSIEQLDIEGFAAKNLGGTLKLDSGAVDFTGGVELEGGRAQLIAKTDLNKSAEDFPAELGISWKGGTLGNSAVKLARYALPLLAGLDPAAANLDFSSGVDLDLTVRGPLKLAGNDALARWLNRWTGDGTVGFRDGSFTPAAQFGQLLSLTGAKSKLEFDGIRSAFKIAEGFVETELLELTSKATKLGLEGRTGLDGALDYRLALGDLLARHKDGRKILEALGGKIPEAKLVGSLGAPEIAMPDFAGALVEGAAKGLIDKGLQKGLDKLFGGKKDGDQKKSDPLQDALQKGLGDLLKRKK